MSTQTNIDFSETRRLATQIVEQGNRILALLGGAHAPLQLSTIRGVTAVYYDFEAEKMLKHDRHKKIAWARQVAMYLCRELANASFPEIAEEFQRDRRSAHNAINIVAYQIQIDEQCREQIKELRRQLTDREK